VGQKVPLLRDAINLIKGKKFLFFADVREAPEGSVHAGKEEAIVLDLIEEMEFSNQVNEII
jgi:hypothetical protein